VLGALALQPGFTGPVFASVVLAVLLMAGLWEAHARKLMPGPSSNPALRFRLHHPGSVPVVRRNSGAAAVCRPACGCQDYTPRARISEIILSTSLVKTEISERYRVTQSLHGSGHGLRPPSGPRVASSMVSEDSVIIVASSDPPAVITMTPEVVKDGEVSKLQWICVGKPAKVMPASCRR
jgi:hypothetical protein